MAFARYIRNIQIKKPGETFKFHRGGFHCGNERL
jgi:hypothetical protein